ncbi:unnamed protein product [Clavelina lepadiformis]|uniref:Uncharacterized protein n=1 Tax=Clavelina lepadiformis TaxID=159417 RepID=A0ABP0FPI3_CLALP
MFAVNVKAPFFLMQHAMPYLLKTKGSVVNISSYLHPSSELLMVSRMSRGALDQLTINAASKYASEGVRVNSVRPATALTELTLAAPEDVLNYEKSKQPIGGFIAHENVANAVYFLASSEAAQTTGQFLNVDGGASVLST